MRGKPLTFALVVTAAVVAGLLVDVAAVAEKDATATGTPQYGGTLNAAFRRENVFATQFHPEKSSRPGLQLLSNFVGICAAARDGVAS